jgi:hypothetical protein
MKKRDAYAIVHDEYNLDAAIQNMEEVITNLCK